MQYYQQHCGMAWRIRLALIIPVCNIHWLGDAVHTPDFTLASVLVNKDGFCSLCSPLIQKYIMLQRSFCCSHTCLIAKEL